MLILCALSLALYGKTPYNFTMNYKKGEKDSTFLKVHDEIGVESCYTSGEKTGQCKLTFIDRFSEELIQQYSSIIGTRNEFDEPY